MFHTLLLAFWVAGISATLNLSCSHESCEAEETLLLATKARRPCLNQGGVSEGSDWKSPCDMGALGNPRESSKMQIARRCLPTFAKDQSVQIFLMENPMGVAGGMVAFHQGFGLQAQCVKQDGQPQSEDCISWTGDLVAGAFDFGNAQLPSINSNGDVEYDTNALQLSFQVHEGIPDYWDRIYGLGTLTGEQANKLFDWASVPNEVQVCPDACSDNATNKDYGLECCKSVGASWPCMLGAPGNTCTCPKSDGPCQIVSEDGSGTPVERAESSAIWSTDSNWFSAAGQYNIMGAESGKAAFRSIAIPYLPATTCADFAFGCLRFLSQTFQLTIEPVPNSDGCNGNGCSATSLKHDRSSFVSYQPRKIGPSPTQDCTDFWKYLLDAFQVIKPDTDASDLKSKLWDMLKDWLYQLNFGGLDKKACIFKNNEWWSTQLHATIYPFDWNMADISKDTGPWYNTDEYNCGKGVITCRGSLDCSVDGLCISGDAYWSPAPYDVVITGGDDVTAEAKDRFETALNATADLYLAHAKAQQATFKFYPWLGMIISV